MTTPDIKLICLDVDRTLMDTTDPDNLFVHPDNIAAINEARRRGIHVCICTGRMVSSAERIAVRLGLADDYLVCFNGAVITLGPTVVSSVTLPQEQFAAIHTAVKAHELFALYYVGREYYVEHMSPQCSLYSRRIEQEPHVVGDAVAELRDVTKVLILARNAEHKQEVLALFRQNAAIEAISSQECFVELVARGVNKGAAVRTLANVLGIGTENVLAVGDEMNDAEMIDTAGVGVVMGDGNPELKKGRCVTGTCREGGVAMAIRRYALRED